jgi:Fic family protein
MVLISSRLHNRILEKKKRLDVIRPLPSGAVRKLQQQMEIEYIYNSNAIEGNTLTLRETQLVLEEGITVGQKSLSEILEAKNHPDAITYVETLTTRNLGEMEIQTLHQLIMKGILKDAGHYRTGDVRITGTDYVPPPAYEVPLLIQQMIEQYNRNPDELLPIELAAWLHHRFVQIHPFVDGNGRVARLLLNLALLRGGYPFTTIRRVDRKKYYAALHRADNGDLTRFANFVVSAVEQTLDLYFRTLQPEDVLMSISEASKDTPYSSEYLSLLARTRRIPAIKTGRKWMVSKDMIRKYAQEQEEKHSPSSSSSSS